MEESRDDDCIKLKTKWAALEALVGNPKRIDLVAAELVQHYERRLEAMEGKAMIVCMTPKTPLKNLAVELLERRLKDEIRSSSRTNVVQEKKYSERLLETLRRYHNRAIETAQVIEELIAMTKDFQEALQRNEQLGLNPDEVAFYDALAERPEVLHQMGDETLKKLATELTEKLRASTTVDWQVRDSVRASMRLLIRRLLRKHKYPPEGQEAATAMVLKQAEALADRWSMPSV